MLTIEEVPDWNVTQLYLKFLKFRMWSLYFSGQRVKNKMTGTYITTSQELELLFCCL